MYILECADGSYYTGSTWNLEKRLWEHQNGQGANHTAKHLPIKLVYCEEGDSIEAAYQREKQIQGWSRKKKQALIAGDDNALHKLAECKNDSHCRNDDLSPRLRSGNEIERSEACPQNEARTLNQTRSLSKARSLSEVEGSLATEIQAGMKELEGVLK
jgi:putative endonuclease